MLIPARPKDDWKVREDAGTDHAVDHQAGDVEAGQALLCGLLLLIGFDIPQVGGGAGRRIVVLSDATA